MYSQHFKQGVYEPGMGAYPARGQLNRENIFSLSPLAPENLVSRDCSVLSRLCNTKKERLSKYMSEKHKGGNSNHNSGRQGKAKRGTRSENTKSMCRELRHFFMPCKVPYSVRYITTKY